MNDQEYLSALRKLRAIYQQIEATGMMAAIKHKSTLERLTPLVLAEAERRATDGK